MQHLDLLVVQSRPSHQILVHQACNALGIFKVRVAGDLAEACTSLKRTPDAVLIDHSMPTLAVQALLQRLVRHEHLRAVLFLGEPPAGAPNLSVEAWRKGLWVLGNLSWPLSVGALHAALQRLRPGDGYRWEASGVAATSALVTR